MIRTVRQQFLSRNFIRVLLGANGYLATEETVYDKLCARVGSPTVTRSEFEEITRYHDGLGHLTNVDNDNGRQWAINDQGRAWAVDHRV
jgi:hypothetical protein